jgi:UDP-N-acetylglucosamine 4,6-dehydratase
VLADRYVIQPTLSFWKSGNHDECSPVPEGFHYSSNKNDEWLDDAALASLLEEAAP